MKNDYEKLLERKMEEVRKMTDREKSVDEKIETIKKNELFQQRY